MQSTTASMLGDLFAAGSEAMVHPLPQLARVGLSFALDPAPLSPVDQKVDWQVIIAASPAASQVAAVLGSASSGDTQLHTSMATVSPDNVLELGHDAICLADLMREFLQSAVCLGQANPDRPGVESQGAGTRGVAYQIRIERELLDAMVKKVASIIDEIQVDPPVIDVERVVCLHEALRVSRIRCTSDQVIPLQ